jgi:hypothetical protein
MTKSARELNIAHEMRQLNRFRPQQPVYNFAELEQVVRGWVVERKETESFSPFETVNS